MVRRKVFIYTEVITMTMAIRNNASATMALDQMWKNHSALSESLKKVSSGMRINGADDDASGYSISERMRVMIRSLDQDERNVCTGANLVKTAEGGMQSILENLRDMKEKALNSANDTNTDVDRAILDKEFQQRIKEIDDIAMETKYNGKILLDGRYYRRFLAGSLPGEPVDGLVYDPNVYITYNSKVSGFMPSPANGDFIGRSSPKSGSIRGYQTATMYTFRDTKSNKPYIEFTKDGRNYEKYYMIDQNGDTIKGMDIHKYVGQSIQLKNENPASSSVYQGTIAIHPINQQCLFLDTTGKLAQDYPYEGNKLFYTCAEQDYSNVTGKTGNLVNDLNDQGLTIYCTQCAQDIAFKFDASMKVGKGRKLVGNKIDRVYGYTVPSTAYMIGIDGIQSVDDILDAIMKGVAAATGQNNKKDLAYVELASLHSVYLHKIKGKYYIAKRDFPMVIAEGFEGRIMKASDVGEMVGEPLIIHTGPKANQNINIYIRDMRSDALGLTGTDVKTRESANNAISVIENAIEYTLDNHTRMGAYRSRLEKTAANIVTARENTENSESTIRDADMAKEMTDYTRNNVLLQAAQSMLAQANQSASSVLSLLQ
ncbi:MAG: flagellin [Selenomonadaceae bacterium]